MLWGCNDMRPLVEPPKSLRIYNRDELFVRCCNNFSTSIAQQGPRKNLELIGCRGDCETISSASSERDIRCAKCRKRSQEGWRATDKLLVDVVGFYYSNVAFSAATSPNDGESERG
jgi:hypothetical protein